MRRVTAAAKWVVLATGLVCLAAEWIAPHSYAEQFREHPNAPPTREFFLGTDDLGRDRFSRLLHASRTSFLLAPATAVVALAIATLAGFAAGYGGRWIDSALSTVMELMLSLPWLFAVLTLRSLLPLNASALQSMIATAALIACVGWAPAARVIRAGVLAVRDSPAILQARASGIGGWRLLGRHMIPALKPVLRAQFWIFTPVFLLTEANLGILGLGVAEPVPTIGGMLAELRSLHAVPEAPWSLAPAIVLVVIVTSLRLWISEPKTWD